jgi:hypothetical protein
MSRLVHGSVAVSLAASVAAACTVAPAGPGDCADGKCDEAGVNSQLAGRADPIARYLSGTPIDDAGVVAADYRAVLFGIAAQEGCGMDTIRTFVVSDDLVTGGEPFPRIVSTICSTDRTRAHRFFISAAFEDSAQPGEIDTRSIEMFAWDPEAQLYRFYETFPLDAAGKIRVDPSPTRCMQCHLTPSDLAPVGMPMTPIMNELTQPWTHWNVKNNRGEGFEPHQFTVPERALKSRSWAEVVQPFLAPAASFEAIVRDGHAEVAQVRVKTRTAAPTVDSVMAMLRPLFCDEQVNYVSEDLQSGVILSSAVVDRGLANMILKIQPNNWPYAWLNGEKLRLTVPGSADQTLEQVPVRGNAAVSTELTLMSRRALSPEQVLRVRALDWQTPVASAFRCELWTQAGARFAAEPPDLSAFPSIAAALPAVLDQILTLGPRRIVSPDPAKFVALGAATADGVAALANGLAAGSLTEDCGAGGAGPCLLTLGQLAGTIDAHVKSFEDAQARPRLFEARDLRICQVLEQVRPEDASDRFDDETVQTGCARECCSKAGIAEDPAEGSEFQVCVHGTVTAIQHHDTSSQTKECAVNCFLPARYANRPSLPAVTGCQLPNRWLP